MRKKIDRLINSYMKICYEYIWLNYSGWWEKLLQTQIHINQIYSVGIRKKGQINIRWNNIYLFVFAELAEYYYYYKFIWFEWIKKSWAKSINENSIMHQTSISLIWRNHIDAINSGTSIEARQKNKKKKRNKCNELKLF